VHFEYAGDNGSRTISWFKEHLRAIATCINEGLPDASLTLIYSGIDTFGLLAASPDLVDARATKNLQIIKEEKSI
jgi:hypothetical protein